MKYTIDHVRKHCMNDSDQAVKPHQESNDDKGNQDSYSDEELARRKAAWKPRQPKVTDGYLKRYAALVTSGNRGAILELPKDMQ